MNKFKKLEYLEIMLHEKNLVAEAALVGGLYDDFYKEAGIIDDGRKVVADILNNPDIIDNISTAVKVAAAISTLVGVSTGAGAAVGASIGASLMKASAGIDIAAAVGYYKNNRKRECAMSVISALLSVPSAWISKMTAFLLSEDFVNLILKYKQLKRNHDTAALLASQISEFAEKTVPVVIDGLVSILNGLLTVITPVIKSVATSAGVSVDKMASDIGAEITKLSAGLTAVSNRIGT